jgi:hypothetical protein
VAKGTHVSVRAYLHGRRRAGDIRSRPQAAKRWRGTRQLERIAPVRPHGDKQVGTLTALGDSQPVAEALRRIGELYAIEASVRGRSSSTYRQAERGKLGPSPGQCFNRPLLTPCMAATICTSARTGAQESVQAAAPERLIAGGLATSALLAQVL